MAFQACKKDELTNPNNRISKKTESSSFDSNKIDDMNKYLSNFINDMKSATKGDEASLSLEEAEWHLTSCLNYQFCNANTGRTNMLYDTIVSKIHVDDNCVTLTDLSKSFHEISAKVTSIYDSYSIADKQVVYIYSVIDTHNMAKDGESSVTTVMATTSRNNHYYFNDWEYACLDQIFPSNIHYNWNTAANVLSEHILYYAVRPETDDFYYVNLRTKTYHYSNYPINDNIEYPYRLYVCGDAYIDDTEHLFYNDMKFYLDSYLGLLKNEYPLPVSVVDAEVIAGSNRGHNTFLLYHDLYGMFGTPVVNNNNDLYN